MIYSAFGFDSSITEGNMEAKSAVGRGGFRSNYRSLVFMMIAGFAFGGASEVLAAATLAIKLPKLDRSVKTVLISVSAVEAETKVLLAGVKLTKKASQVTLKIKASPLVVFADLVDSVGHIQKGHSAVLRPVDRKKLTVNLSMAAVSSFASPGSVDAGGTGDSPPSGMNLIGVPSSGFTVQGVQGLTGQDVARVVTTDLTKAPCYGQDGGFSVVETDPDKLAIIKAEIELSNSEWADPATRLTDQSVPPAYFVNGSWTSDGENMTATYRIVDSEGNELLSETATGPEADFSSISSNVLGEMMSSLCCKPKNFKCAKNGSIQYDYDYDIPHPECPQNHQSYQGTIDFLLVPSVADAQNACEYAGQGNSVFTVDGVCGEAFLHTTCTIIETIMGKVPTPLFPSCNTKMVVDFAQLWDCVTIDNAGTQYSSFPGAWTEEFQYKDGYVVDHLTPGLVGRAQTILHLK
jgi:hypothetical protein